MNALPALTQALCFESCKAGNRCSLALMLARLQMLSIAHNDDMDEALYHADVTRQQERRTSAGANGGRTVTSRSMNGQNENQNMLARKLQQARQIAQVVARVTSIRRLSVKAQRYVRHVCNN